MVVDMPLQRSQIGLPESLQDHTISALRTVKEASDVEALIGREDRADTRSGGRNESHVAGVGRSSLRRHRLCNRRCGSRVRVGGLQDRLLLMPGALAKYAVEAQADE